MLKNIVFLSLNYLRERRDSGGSGYFCIFGCDIPQGTGRDRAGPERKRPAFNDMGASGRSDPAPGIRTGVPPAPTKRNKGEYRIQTR